MIVVHETAAYFQICNLLSVLSEFGSKLGLKLSLKPSLFFQQECYCLIKVGGH